MKRSQEIQIAGLLHDIGKFIRKTSSSNLYKTNLSHEALSEQFIKNNSDIFKEYDVDLIIKLARYHHSSADSSSFFTAEEKSMLDLLKVADSFSASGDRRTENMGNESDGHAEYAPLYSVIAQTINDSRYAVIVPERNEREYNVKKFAISDNVLLSDDKKSIDSYYKNELGMDLFSNLNSLFEMMTEELNDIPPEELDVSVLNDVLEEYLIYINPNTKRLPGSKLGNTTTSLYDHSKTTSAIAGCLYRHYCQTGEKTSRNSERTNITFTRLRLYDDNNFTEEDCLYDFVNEQLRSIGLWDTCIISKSQNEIYFIYPNSDIPQFLNELKKKNETLFYSFGATLNCECIKNWNFIGNIEFSKEFARKATKFIGIKEIIKSRNNAALEIDFESNQNREEIYADKAYKKYFMMAFKINNYTEMLDKLLSDNNSISKLTTYLRTIEAFFKSVKTLLIKEGCHIVKQDADMLWFYCKPEKIFILHGKTLGEYRKFAGEDTGLTFSYREFSRYSNLIEMLKSDTELIFAAVSKKGPEYKRHSYTIIGGSMRRISPKIAFNLHQKALSYSDVENSTKYKVAACYKEILDYFEGKNRHGLLNISKLFYLRSQTSVDKTSELQFLDDFFKPFEQNELSQIDRKMARDNYAILDLVLNYDKSED